MVAAYYSALVAALPELLRMCPDMRAKDGPDGLAHVSATEVYAELVRLRDELLGSRRAQPARAETARPRYRCCCLSGGSRARQLSNYRSCRAAAFTESPSHPPASTLPCRRHHCPGCRPLSRARPLIPF